jgi:hypothetical protein
VLLVEPSMTRTNVTSVDHSTPAHQAQTLHTYFLAEKQGSTTMTGTDSQSLDSPSPRSITDYSTAMGSHPPTGRRSLSKTLGVDFQEAAPIQPMRRPSSEPEQYHVIARRSNPPHRLAVSRALVRRQSSNISVGSSGSTTSSKCSADSQSSSNSDTVATFPSFCSHVSATSEATIKIQNGWGRTLAAGDEGTAPVINKVYSNNSGSMIGAPKTRSISFLPSSLEQVSERSISEHSESTYDNASPTMPKSKILEGRVATSDIEGEVGIPPKTPSFHFGDTSIASISSSTCDQMEILFQPPSSPSALPVDYESIIDRFEDGSPIEGNSFKAPLSGRFLHVLKNKFR